MSQNAIPISLRNMSQNLSTLRNAGHIPGIMYGQSLKNSIPIQINARALESIIQDTTKTRFPLELDGETYDCILREFQTDRLHTEILHVDFQLVKPGEKIKMPVPIFYEGLDMLRSKKQLLEKAISKVSVLGVIENLPDHFVLDVSPLSKGDKLVVSSLNLPEGCEVLLHPDTILATIQ